MTNAKVKFSLITSTAILLAVGSGIFLKQNSGSMSQIQIYGWGFVFVASLLTAVRGFRYLMSLR